MSRKAFAEIALQVVLLLLAIIIFLTWILKKFGLD